MLLSIFLSVFVVIGNTPLIRLANFHLQREVDLEMVKQERFTAVDGKREEGEVEG